MTQEEIIALVQECTAKLGHPRSIAQFEALAKLSKDAVRRRFGSHRRMLAESGIQRECGRGYSVSARSLFLYWAGVEGRF